MDDDQNGTELLDSEEIKKQTIKEKDKKETKKSKKNIFLLVIPLILLIIVSLLGRKTYNKLYFEPNPRNVILCPFDNGIRVMQQFERGVYGAENAPAVIFEKLFNDIEPFYIIPNVEHFNHGINEDSYRAHHHITKYISNFNKPFVVLGGDHSITFPIVRGIAQNKNYKNKKLGLIYFDAHYDMRPLEGKHKNVLSSGNSFYRILTEKVVKGVISGENMVVIGIKKGTSEIFKFMEKMSKEHNMTTFYLDEINEKNYMDIMVKAIKIASKGTDGIYLSFDLDVLDKKYVPGASCPAEKGLELEWAKKMVSMHKFIGADFVEASNRVQNYKHELDPEGDAKLDKSAKSASEIIKNLKLTNL